MTNVSLTAAPDTGQTFSNWGGACVGTDPVCTLTLSADMNVSATFTGELLSGIVAVDGNGDVIGRVLGGIDITTNSYDGTNDIQILTETGYDIIINRKSAASPTIASYLYYADSQCSGVPIGHYYAPGVVYKERNHSGYFYSPKDSVATTYVFPNIYSSFQSGDCAPYGQDVTSYPVFPNDPAITDIPNAGYTGPIRIEYR